MSTEQDPWLEQALAGNRHRLEVLGVIPRTQAYRMTGNRCSLLPIAQYCAAAPILSSFHGAGRPAAMSSAFHAMLAKEPNAQELWALLSDEEQSIVRSWKPPGTIVFQEGDSAITLDYESAEKELKVGLDGNGNYLDPSANDVLTRGTLDFGWVREVRAKRVAYVADIKKTEWTATDGPDSLQIAAYAFAYAAKHDCEAFVTGIWVAESGIWQWSREMVDLSSRRAIDLWERVRSAASNVPRGEGNDYSTGEHCRSCWARLHCPEYTLPAALASTALAPLTTGEALAELTPDAAGELVLKVQAAADVIEAARKTLTEYARRGGIVRNGAKLWRAIEMPGRESVDAGMLRDELGDDVVQRYVKKGAPYQQMRWVKG